MSATRDLIAAALTAADLMDEFKYSDLQRAATTLREMCARAMVQPAAPDMAEVERLAAYWRDRVMAYATTSIDSHGQYLAYQVTETEARTALIDYVRNIIAERDVLIADNERLSGLYEQAVKGRADMRSALRDARAAAPQPVSEEPCRIEQPTGWRCTRANGHKGPCAAVEDRS